MWEPKAPTTIEEYLGYVDQAIFETEEIIACAADEDMFEEGIFSEMLPVYGRLRDSLKALDAEIRAGRHVFADGSDLPIIALVREARGPVPFWPLLKALNQFHRKGIGSEAGG